MMPTKMKWSMAWWHQSPPVAVPRVAAYVYPTEDFSAEIAPLSFEAREGRMLAQGANDQMAEVDDTDWPWLASPATATAAAFHSPHADSEAYEAIFSLEL
ncbi:hypothetical protein Ae201684P_012519 [Aphanomyces euteiches]|nr:hypothetical protein Ae201684P_012519 [Aphanomyces euteiches]KAH9146090.1 hypothetical protein AeRB84_010033 [Aphanomyces euteiches]